MKYLSFCQVIIASIFSNRRNALILPVCIIGSFFVAAGNNIGLINAQLGSESPYWDYNQGINTKPQKGPQYTASQKSVLIEEGEICLILNENETQTITAPEGAIFTEVIFASYGNASGDCDGEFMVGSCHASASQSVIENLSIDRNSFTISANNTVFQGDPCVGILKKLHLKIAYSSNTYIIPTPQTQNVCLGSESQPIILTGGDGEICQFLGENVTQTIIAPSGAVFTEVLFASYGNATGDCSEGFMHGSCHAANTKSVIEDLAIGKNSFTISVDNNVFGGDPCSGTAKKLHFKIAYSYPEYSWINDNPAIGLPHSGTGDIPSFFAAVAGHANITLTAILNGFVPAEPTTFAYNVQERVNLYVDGNRPLSGSGDRWGAAYKTLQEALSAARNPTVCVDSILVAKGTYLISDNGQPFSMVEGVQILGGYPNGGGERDIVANVTVLNGRNYGSVIRNDGDNLTAASVLDGFTITHGFANGNGQNNYGGAIYNRFSSPTISNCIFKENATTTSSDGRGGSIYNYGSSSIIANCTFYGPGNSSQNGGAVYNDFSSTIIENCVFKGNYARDYGGAIYNKGGTYTITDCSFVENTSSNSHNSGMGGAIYNDGATVIINGCEFSSNFTLQDGGAISSISSQVTLNDSSFSANLCQSNGGAVYNGMFSSFSATNCLFEGNEAKNGGGGIHNSTGSLTLNNCMFIENRVGVQGSSGGGVSFSGNNVSVKIFNSLFVGNKANLGGGVNLPSGARIVNSTFFGNHAYSMGGGIYGSAINIINSVVYGNTALVYLPQIFNGNNVFYSNVQGGHVGTGNINKDPQFINPSDPDGEDNIWGTPDDGFIMSPCSSASDPGSNTHYSNFGGDLENDLDLAGNPRLYDQVIDMGAYETQGIPCSITWIGTPETGYWTNGTGPGLGDNAQVEGSLIISSNLQAKDFRVLEGAAVTIVDGGLLKLAGKLINENEAGSFIVKSGGNLIQTEEYASDDNEGRITVERESQDIVRLDYTLWASPTREQQIQSFSPMTLPNRIYTYETDASNQSTNGAYVMVPDAGQNFEPGKGYLIRAPNDWNETHNNQEAPYLGKFLGTPFNGNLNVATYPNGNTSVGNPYPSNISPEDFLSANPGINSIYFWNNPERVFNPSTGLWEYTGTRYVTYTQMGFSDQNYDGRSIAVGQGFIVRSTTVSANFSNSMRVNSDEVFFKNPQTDKHRIWLKLSSIKNQNYNQILIGYMDGATNRVDPQIDGLFFGYTGSAIYTLIDEEKYTTQGRALPFNLNDVVRLGFKAGKTDKYKISYSNFDGFFAQGEVIVYLRDKEERIIHNLIDSPYEFKSKEGEYKDRFEIIYKKKNAQTLSHYFSDELDIYKIDNEILIESDIEKIKFVQIYDHHGRLLHQNKINTKNYKVNSILFDKGILFVIAQTADGMKTTKKLIND